MITAQRQPATTKALHESSNLIYPFPGRAAFKALPRGTLHVVLTKPGDQGLRLMRPAADHWQAALASVGGFQAIESDERGPHVADPRTTAAAIAAQVRCVTPQLLAAGVRPRSHPVWHPASSASQRGLPTCQRRRTDRGLRACMSRRRKAAAALQPPTAHCLPVR